jgi:hypothetical protein
MQVGLDNAQACLASQSPREYTQQLMLGALTLQKMRGGAGKGADKDKDKREGLVNLGLEELRQLMEPDHTTQED